MTRVIYCGESSTCLQAVARNEVANVREEKRAAAVAQLPQMLADEESLRQGLNTLHKRAKRMLQHAEYDKQLGALVSRADEIRAALVSELADFTEQLGRIVLGSRKECEAAREQVGKLKG